MHVWLFSNSFYLINQGGTYYKNCSGYQQHVANATMVHSLASLLIVALFPVNVTDSKIILNGNACRLV